VTAFSLAPLRELASVFNGKTPSKTEHRDEGHPVLKIRDVDENGIFRGPFESFVEDAFAARHSERFAADGDTLILNAAHNADYVGSKTFFVSGECVGALATGEWLIVRPISSRLDARYITHWLQTVIARRAIRNLVKGIHLYPKDVERLDVPLPTLSQQRRIAGILDQADELRRKRRAALSRLKELDEAVFLDMFGDPVKNPKGWQRSTLGGVIATGPQNGLYKPSSDYGSGTPILRIDAFYDGEVTDTASLKRLRVSAVERKLYGLKTGDIVVNRVNSMEYLGKSALIPDLGEPTVFESNMMRFGLDRDRADAHYIVQLLQTSFIKAQIRTAAKNAVNQSSINQQDVMGFQINVPPLALQKEFRNRQESSRQLRGQFITSAAKLDALFASLQHRAFSGGLTSKDVERELAIAG
jgi:type I restriction enzyme, S subunit